MERLEELNWFDKTLVDKSEISKGQISKLKKGLVERLTAETFYKIYTAFGDLCSKASKIVYPTLDFKINKYVAPERSDFGQFMLQFEESKNSPEEVATKTGIDDERIKEIYFRRGALEAYELLLIEKAVGKNPGELFEAFFGQKK
ncbi:hypothetical protein JHJ32_21910 [Parapedobacter sp. ISTM3]|nr:hypothetical protein [Parapedobacter sp. ISTM3]